MSSIKERLEKIRDRLLPVVMVWHGITPEGGKAFWMSPTRANNCKCGWIRFATDAETAKYAEVEDKISELSLDCSFQLGAEDVAAIDEGRLSELEALVDQRDMLLKGAREVT